MYLTPYLYLQIWFLILTSRGYRCMVLWLDGVSDYPLTPTSFVTNFPSSHHTNYGCNVGACHWVGCYAPNLDYGIHDFAILPSTPESSEPFQQQILSATCGHQSLQLPLYPDILIPGLTHITPTVQDPILTYTAVSTLVLIQK